MSVINTMLRDLDRRRVEVEAGNGYQHVRAVASQPQWRTKAIVVVVALVLALLALVFGVSQIRERVSPPVGVPLASPKSAPGAPQEPRAAATPQPPAQGHSDKAAAKQNEKTIEAPLALAKSPDSQSCGGNGKITGAQIGRAHV